jgi:hypothetical protein
MSDDWAPEHDGAIDTRRFELVGKEMIGGVLNGDRGPVNVWVSDLRDLRTKRRLKLVSVESRRGSGGKQYLALPSAIWEKLFVIIRGR